MALTRIETDARGVARLILNRPEKHNAMSGEMIAELHDAATRLGADDAVRVVVLEGAGPTFCAGGDLGWMRDQVSASAKTRREGAMKLARMLDAMNTLPKPLIARVHGNAFGGGVGMISICDIAFGAEGTLYGLTETKLGLIPATIGPYVVARMGEGHARRVFMNSRRFDAVEAQSYGLLAKVLSPNALDDAVAEEVDAYLACAPGAVAAAKALARSLGPRINETVMEESAAALVAAWEGDEVTEGLAAFFEKRAPRWAKS